MPLAVKISECINYERLNTAGFWSLLKLECVTCNMCERREQNTRCEDCPFIFNSVYNHKQKGNVPKRSRVGCGVKFKEFGLKKIKYQHVGKHQLYFFLFHPELRFRMPDFPATDMFGNPFSNTWTWHIHHLNGLFYDDRKENLLLCLNTEHPFIASSGIKSWRWNY